jgi:hypothetical protein
MLVWATTHLVSVVIVLAIVMPKAHFANLVLRPAT